MARIRSVHPGLFTDEAFVSVSMAARILLIGLWTEADDGGVFEWKPVQIKMRLFPADAVDIPALLAELLAANIVMGFSLDGRSYGALRNFMVYQRPKSPKFVHASTPDVMEYVGGNRHGTAVTGSYEPMNFPRDLTSAERQRRKRERDKGTKVADGGHSRDGGEACHGSGVTCTELSRQMEEGGGREEPPIPPADTGGDGDGFKLEGGQPKRANGTSARASPADPADDPKFREFWTAYPHRGKATDPRKPAAERFHRLTRRGVDPARIIAGAQGYAAACAEMGISGTDKVKQAQSWLNQACWEQYAASALEEEDNSPAAMAMKLALERRNDGVIMDIYALKKAGRAAEADAMGREYLERLA